MNTITLPYIDEDTRKKLDYLFQAVRQGRMDDTIKLVEFVEKLEGGTPTPRDISLFIDAIDDMNEEVARLRSDRDYLKSKVIELEGKASRMESDITSVAKALAYLFEPSPLGKAYDLSDIRNFLQGKGIYLG